MVWPHNAGGNRRNNQMQSSVTEQHLPVVTHHTSQHWYYQCDAFQRESNVTILGFKRTPPAAIQECQHTCCMHGCTAVRTCLAGLAKRFNGQKLYRCATKITQAAGPTTDRPSTTHQHALKMACFKPWPAEHSTCNLQSVEHPGALGPAYQDMAALEAPCPKPLN
jgi:hypothetical protein